jgi:hypothetical protein
MAVLRRVLIQTFKNPAIIIPSLAFPLVFLIAFAGGLSTVASVPGLLMQFVALSVSVAPPDTVTSLVPSELLAVQISAPFEIIVPPP